MDLSTAFYWKIVCLKQFPKHTGSALLSKGHFVNMTKMKKLNTVWVAPRPSTLQAGVPPLSSQKYSDRDHFPVPPTPPLIILSKRPAYEPIRHTKSKRWPSSILDGVPSNLCRCLTAGRRACRQPELNKKHEGRKPQDTKTDGLMDGQTERYATLRKARDDKANTVVQTRYHDNLKKHCAIRTSWKPKCDRIAA